MNQMSVMLGCYELLLICIVFENMRLPKKKPV